MDVLKEKTWTTMDDAATRDSNKTPPSGTQPSNGKLIKSPKNANESKLLFNQETDSNPAILEQYKLYVGTTNQTTVMQTQANRFFLTTNTLIVGFIVSMPQFAMHPTLPLWLLFVCLVGIFLTITWFVTIRAYRDLNSARLQTIQAIETKLPANIYLREWQIARAERRQGIIRKVSVEQVAPYVYGVLYVILTMSLFLIAP